MEGNLKFGVIFGGNHAAVTTEGAVTITTPGEVFHLEKSLPNMMINNVVWGLVVPSPLSYYCRNKVCAMGWPFQGLGF